MASLRWREGLGGGLHDLQGAREASLGAGGRVRVNDVAPGGAVEGRLGGTDSRGSLSVTGLDGGAGVPQGVSGAQQAAGGRPGRASGA